MSNRLQQIVEDILDAECPVELLDRDTIKDLYRKGEDFQTAQQFLVFLQDNAHGRVAVCGSSAASNDDSRHHPLALIVDDVKIIPLRVTTRPSGVRESLGLEVEQ